MKNKIKEMTYCLAMSLAGTIILFLPASGLADENGGWSFSFTPYIFAVGLEGDVATLPPAASAEVDVPFSDILDNLDLALIFFIPIFQWMPIPRALSIPGQTMTRPCCL